MDAEIYDKAHNIMTLRRKKAEEMNDERIRKVSGEIPEIAEINHELFNTGKELINVGKNGENIEENIAEAEKKNRELQKRLKFLLTSHGYPPNYTETTYNCPYCRDTGYIDNNFCGCMKSLFGKLMAEKFNKNTYLQLSNFDDFDLKYYSGDDYHTMKKIFDFAKNYAENFTQESGSIMMSGNTGLGKTHLSLAIADCVIRKGVPVVYDSIINILDCIEREHFGYEKSRDKLDAIEDTELLILDDLGTEYDTKFTASTIFDIINTRISRRKPTIISTNLNLNDIKNRYGDRIASRLYTNYTQMHFSGEDVRLQIRRGQLNRK